MLRFWLHTRERFRLWKFISQPESRPPCVSRPGGPGRNATRSAALFWVGGVRPSARGRPGVCRVRWTPVLPADGGRPVHITPAGQLPRDDRGQHLAPGAAPGPGSSAAPTTRVGTLPPAAHRGKGAAVPTAPAGAEPRSPQSARPALHSSSKNRLRGDGDGWDSV